MFSPLIAMSAGAGGLLGWGGAGLQTNRTAQAVISAGVQYDTVSPLGHVVPGGDTTVVWTEIATGGYGLVRGGMGAYSALRSGRVVENASAAAAPLRDGVDHEAARLAQLGIPKNNVVWRPTQADFDSAAFKVIVGKPKFTSSGLPKGTIFDGATGGNLEIKGGASMLDSSYQLRLQTYRSLKTNTPFTIETTRPINPAFKSWLDRWGVSVARPK
ncbi:MULTISPECIES: hypothetical protein [unclassified Sphingopyxis]|uniref:hypothetical protein n=1 Tax=unclassified Sphingopyxis TaxID=2614943 RepID=UPI000AEDBCF2|nr:MULTISPECIES: hypothetical protein [unclassified Sphingopyxis]